MTTDVAAQATANAHLERLQPQPLWQHFRTLCNTPRPSGGEAAVMAKIEAWAVHLGLQCLRDQAGNALVRKPASTGYEKAPGVILQGHVDMVAQSDVPHDFTKDPILTEVRDGWLWAKGTTLGADNGIGAAAALAILEDDSLRHGPLEALFTVAEETSMGGASQLEPGWLQGRYLLNLDTEDRGEAYIGCAGGVHVGIQESFQLEPVDAGWVVARITLTGLQGGHSGVDIHKQLGNANPLLARLLLQLLNSSEPGDLRLIAYQGGSMANAITRTAEVTLALPAQALDSFEQALSQAKQSLLAELATVEPRMEVTLVIQKGRPPALSAVDSTRLLRLLAALPYGIERFSDAIPGVVETSNNLGIIQLAEGQLRIDAMVRSLRDSATWARASKIEALARLAGMQVGRSAFYPGWVPRADSPLLSLFKEVHRRVEGHEPQVKVIHAGLECGIIGAKYPELDMISFGPTVRGAHSPSERVDISAVQAFWTLLRETIEALAKEAKE